MFWLGKFLGVLFGYMIAGPFGAVLGLILGHYFDLALKGHWSLFPANRQQQNQAQTVFFSFYFRNHGIHCKVRRSSF